MKRAHAISRHLRYTRGVLHLRSPPSAAVQILHRFLHNLTNVLVSSPASVQRPVQVPETASETNTEAVSAELPKSLPSLAAKAVRLANVERLRVFAMLEIVRYHDHGDRLAWVGGLGLPTF